MRDRLYRLAEGHKSDAGQLDPQCVSPLGTRLIDAVQTANAGHPAQVVAAAKAQVARQASIRWFKI